MKRPAEDQAPAGAAEAAGGAPAETNRGRKARKTADEVSRKEQFKHAKADFFRGHTLHLDSLDDSGRDKQRGARRHAWNGTRPLAEIQHDMEVVSAPVSVPLPYPPAWLLLWLDCSLCSCDAWLQASSVVRSSYTCRVTRQRYLCM